MTARQNSREDDDNKDWISFHIKKKKRGQSAELWFSLNYCNVFTIMTTKILSYYDLDDNDSNKDSRSISGLPELLQRDYHDDHDSDDNGDTGDWHCIDNMTAKMDFPNHRNWFVLGSS